MSRVDQNAAIDSAPRSGMRVEGRLSVVVPIYNEALNVQRFFDRLVPVLEALTNDYEIICINDGSRDDSLERILACRAGNASIKLIDLARNFGKDVALSAGLHHARGDAVICMDADLQHPPEHVPLFVEKWQEGYQVVFAYIRSRAEEGWLKRLMARGFYWLFNRLSDPPIPPHAGDFRLLDRCVVEVINQMPERTRFMKGMFNWAGFRQTGIPYDPAPRQAGVTAWGFWRLWNFAIDGIVAFSTVPLAMWSYFGFVISLISLLYGGFLVISTLISGIDVPGYASLMVAVLFLGGVQLISLGVIGEYLARIYREVKGRPLYVARKLYGLDDDPWRVVSTARGAGPSEVSVVPSQVDAAR